MNGCITYDLLTWLDCAICISMLMWCQFGIMMTGGMLRTDGLFPFFPAWYLQSFI